MEHIRIGGRLVVVKIIRTARKKSIAMEVTTRHEVVVRAPRHLSDSRIREKVLSCSAWLEKRFDMLEKSGLGSAPRRLGSGARLFFLGQPKELAVERQAGGLFSVAEQGTCLVARMPLDLGPLSLENALRTVLTAWFREQARRVIAERLRLFAPLVGVDAPPMRISNARKRWGSCGATGRLNFSWRLVMAPFESIDYVVVHELCHLLHRDHSGRFWREVERVMPDHRARRRHLHEHGLRYDL